MTPQIQAILDLLTGDDFPYPVAIFRDQDCDLGPILSVDAFDLPASVILGVLEHLCELLGPVETIPMLLAGAVYDFESADKRESLPEDTVWYEPRRTHAQVH